MSQKRNKQRINERRALLSNCLICILLLIIFIFLLLYWLHYLIVLDNLQNGNLYKYTGSYEVQKLYRGRNVVCIVTLENGDPIWIPISQLKGDGDLYEHDQLSFTYSAPIFKLPPAYTCIEISTIDGGAYILERAVAEKEVRLGAALFWVFPLLVLPLVVLFGQQIYKELMKLRQKRR